jgi:coproporphyrinogen III oxidase
MYCGTGVVSCQLVGVIRKLDKKGREADGRVHLKGHSALGTSVYPHLNNPSITSAHERSRPFIVGRN